MNQNKSLLITALLLVSNSLYANEVDLEKLSVEELRLEKVAKTMPQVLDVFANNIEDFTQAWTKTSNYQEAKKVTLNHDHQYLMIAPYIGLDCQPVK